MAAPTLATNAAADTLRILGGTEGDPVTWNDVWDWDDGGGSSGGDGDVPKDGGGTAKVSTFMTETVADRVYLILKNIDFGDGTTPSYFASESEMVYMLGYTPIVQDNATLRIGNASNSNSKNGSYWAFEGGASIRRITKATNSILQIYGSLLYIQNNSFIYPDRGTLLIRDTNIITSSCAIVISPYMSSVTLNNVYVYGQYIDIRALATLNDVHLESGSLGFVLSSLIQNVTLENLNFTNCSNDVRNTTAYTLNIKNPKSHITNKTCAASSTIVEQYTFNLHIRDKDGANLAGVTCLLQDVTDTQVFSVETAADGTITEQTVDYKKWEGTAETLTEYTPHKLTLSKTNYETLIIDAITMDEKKDLEFTLLPALAATDVRDGTTFNDDRTGTLDLPAVTDVEKGVVFDNTTKTGTFKEPGIANVAEGTQYGADDTEFTGTYTKNIVSGAVITGQNTVGTITGQDTVGTVTGE